MTLRTTTRRACVAVLCVAAGTALAACGDDKDSASTVKYTDVAGVQVGNATDLKVKPKINIPDEVPPTMLIKKDIVVGTGPTVKTGDALSAQYVGVAWSGNKQFDASWDRGKDPTTFTLAKGSVIDGWTEGLPGMKVGGRRLLIIPPAKGYGDQGQGTDIPAGETLVFVVDATKTAKAPKTDTSASSGAASGISEEQLQQAIQAQTGGQVQAAP
ncbi:MAG: FKBP-type peptidyl-prolyl cis-trans isomerase [Solirubrobacteraceae bacterium]|nr:FKBP-type peptidyl-prolyl cis-trans isomerase [Solirubrobacteraceae bacterium]